MSAFKPLVMSSMHVSDAFLAKLPGQGGIFLGVDGVYHYAIMLTSIFRLEIVRKTREEPISSVIAGLPPQFRVVVNGNYFKCVSRGCYLYANMGDVAMPDETDSVGDVVSRGGRVLPDRGAGSSYAYFGRKKGSSAADYIHGMGNPAAPLVHEGAGGLGPLILANPKTGTRIRYGVGNRYAPGYTGGVSRGDPGAHWGACVQRNNETYASMNAELTSGMGAVGVSSSRHFLVAAIKPDGKTGSLDSLRDKLWDIGVDGACFLDGSNSVFMAVDRRMVLPPAGFKNNLIEVGFGFRRYA